jgi:anti-anti-sigma factor
MQIIHRQLGDVAVLDLKGTIHCADGDRELEAIINELTKRECVRLVLNLREVTHIDTMCLGVFIAAQVRFQRRSGGVTLLHTPARIQHMLRIARLDQFLPTYATEEAAIRALANSHVPSEPYTHRALVDS